MIHALGDQGEAMLGKVKDARNNAMVQLLRVSPDLLEGAAKNVLPRGGAERVERGQFTGTIRRSGFNLVSVRRQSAEPIGSAKPAPRRDRRNTVSRARPYRCGTP